MPSKKNSDPNPAQNPDFTEQVRDAAHPIWLAGLAAFAQAQQEGSKVFDALVKEGTDLQRKAQSLAEDKWREATEKVSHLAAEAGTRASHQWDRIETTFEERVARALKRLGVPSVTELERLQKQINDLQQALANLRQQPAAGARARAVARATPARSRRKTAGS